MHVIVLPDKERAALKAHRPAATHDNSTAADAFMELKLLYFFHDLLVGSMYVLNICLFLTVFEVHVITLQLFISPWFNASKKYWSIWFYIGK